MTVFCNYKNLFGEPGKGVHATRLGPFAFNDLIGMIILIIIITYIIEGDVMWVGLSVWGVAEILHWLFCVDTTTIRVIKSVFECPKL